ncbi:MAG: branched-chain amino acid ABC transporter permease [Rhizobiaceae bacterium]
MIVAAILPAIAIGALVTGETFYLTLATRMAVLALAATGLNLVLGVGGLVSFGHAAFFGIGGYAAGIVASHAMSGEPLLGLSLAGAGSMLVAWPLAIVVAALVALPIGAISLRTSGVYFIMITLAFAQMVFYFAISWPAYGGEDGLSIALRNGLPGVNTARPLDLFLVVYGVLAVGLVAFAVLRESRFGTALEAGRQNEVRLTALGVEPFPIRLVAFVISAGITALAGALYAELNRFVSPSMLSWQMSGELIVLIILGGTGRLFGPLAGAIVFVLLEFWLGGITERWQFFLGLILLGFVLFARGGIIGILAGARRHG